MENRAGPWSQESSDDQDETSEPSVVKRGAELHLPRVPLREVASPAVPESRSVGFAAFMEQQRRADEARRVADTAAKSKEAEDDEEEQPKQARSAAPEQDGVSIADVATGGRLDTEQAHDQAEAAADIAPAEQGMSVDAVLQPAGAAELQPVVASAEHEQHIDPAALEQLQREAEEYANALLTDAELTPAPSEPAPEVDGLEAGEAMDAELAGDEIAAAEEAARELAEDEEDLPVATTAATVPRPRAGGHTAFAPIAPPPLMPIPGYGVGSANGGIPVRPSSASPLGHPSMPSTGGGGGLGGPSRGYGGGGGGGFGPPSPGMGPSGPNALGGPSGLAGNVLHGHEHWHPKTFLALAGAILVSDMLGRSRDRKITREMRERTDKLKTIIDQHTAESEQQHAASKRQAAEMQESYQDSRQKLASRLDQVTSQRAYATESQSSLPQKPEAPAPAQTVESLLRMNQPAVTTERGVTSPNQRFMRPTGEMPNMAERAVLANRAPELQPQAPIAPEIVPDTQRFAELQAQPDMVLEQVAQAAELGVSTEKVYERRQEVRDEPGTAGGAQGGGSATGTDAYAAGYGYQQPSISGRQFADTQAQMAQGQGYQKPGEDKYRKAMQAGFWGGVAIIALAIIAVFAL